MSTRGMVRRIAAVAAMAACAVGFAAAPAFAHASLESTDPSAGAIVPTPPASISLQFSESVSVGLGGVRVLAADGGAVSTGKPATPAGRPNVVVTTLPKLQKGTYVVTWRVVSADSHPVRGAFTFSVQQVTKGGGAKKIAGDYLSGRTTSTSVDTTYAVVRFLVYTAMALAIGLIIGSTFVWRRALEHARVRRLLWGSWGVLLVASVAAFMVQGPYGAGLPLADGLKPSVWSDVFGTRIGMAIALRVALVLLVLPLLLLARRSPRPAWASWIAVGAIVGIAATPALGGHASVGPQNAIAIVVDALHVLAMGVWFGGLTLLVLLTTKADAPEALEALPEWSRTATIAVLVVIFTGVARGWRELGGLAHVFDSNYGRLLAIKVGLVLIALLVATVARDAVQRRWALDPDEVAEADRERAELVAAGRPIPSRRGHSLVPDDDAIDAVRYVLPEESARRRLLRAVGVEIALLVAVLGVTAVLVNTAPTAAAKAGPYSATLDAGPILADVVVTPARVGPNEVHLTLSKRTGGPAGALNVTVQFALPSKGIDPIDVTMRKAGVDHYISTGLTLPIPGDWAMTLKVLTDPVTEESTTATVSVR